MALNLRDDLLKASRVHFECHIEKHRINVEILLENCVGVGDHPDVMDTIEKELEQMAKYQDMLDILDKHFSSDKKTPRELLTEMESG